jgi:hypothetical protein
VTTEIRVNINFPVKLFKAIKSHRRQFVIKPMTGKYPLKTRCKVTVEIKREVCRRTKVWT